MPDLEQSIAEWRRQMLAAGIKTPVPLEELESHLCDDVEQQMRTGLTAQDAFDAAIRRMGMAAEVKGEFDRVHTNPSNPREAMHYKLRRILVVIAVIAIAVGLILPKVADWRAHGTLTFSGVAFLLIGAIACTVVASWVAIGGLRSLERRFKE